MLLQGLFCDARNVDSMFGARREVIGDRDVAELVLYMHHQLRISDLLQSLSLAQAFATSSPMPGTAALDIVDYLYLYLRLRFLSPGQLERGRAGDYICASKLLALVPPSTNERISLLVRWVPPRCDAEIDCLFMVPTLFDVNRAGCP